MNTVITEKTLRTYSCPFSFVSYLKYFIQCIAFMQSYLSYIPKEYPSEQVLLQVQCTKFRFSGLESNNICETMDCEMVSLDNKSLMHELLVFLKFS